MTEHTKEKLVQYKGGKCCICGYDKCMTSLHFHHRDPNEKDFGVTGKTVSYERLMKEVDKCELVCSNCHRIRSFKRQFGEEAYNRTLLRESKTA